MFSAVALPLTYLPILIIANDREYMGDKVNGRGMNFIGSVYLVVILAEGLTVDFLSFGRLLGNVLFYGLLSRDFVGRLRLSGGWRRF